ncbi:hypothetical protein ACFL1R_08310 [Candidatus Latescibacterota bacterium]
MWERINKYVYFISIMITDAWLWHDYYTGEKPWEQAVIILGLLGALIYEEIKDLRKGKDTDSTLFHKFLEVLPYEGSISFIDCTDMSATHFDPEKLNDLRYFYYHWDDASHEFLDKSIEKRRKILWDLAEKYIMALVTNTVPTDDDLQTVPHEWKTEQPELFKEVIDDFHNLAGQIVIAHQEMIRYAKKKLKI